MGLSGEEIRQNVLQQLVKHPQLQNENILVDVESEELILRGEVESKDHKWLAEEVAYDVLGVVHVKNELNVLKQ